MSHPKRDLQALGELLHDIHKVGLACRLAIFAFVD